jgi:Putative Flp pilus-assembly TadE/G-like
LQHRAKALTKTRISLRRSGSNHGEQGIIIVLVAVFMLGAVGAMAALSIDVVTLYTARSEAQLAADAAALAGARVLANSGMTSDTTGGLTTSAEGLAKVVASNVAQSNRVGRTNLNAGAGEITVTFAGTTTDPTITVSVRKTNLPTFFARVWGRTQITVAAAATAEAYNPSGATPKTPVATICVKPWLLPNLNPAAAGAIFDRTTGAISPTLPLGWQSDTTRLRPYAPAGPAAKWRYYPGNPISFPPPAQLRACTALSTPTAYEKSIAGCVQTPIACNDALQWDNSPYPNRDLETANAVNCLTHATADEGDTVIPSSTPPATPFEFVAGDDNPIPGARGNDVMISDSLVTVPVYDVGAGGSAPPPAPPGTATIVGFVQLFLDPDGDHTSNDDDDLANFGRVKTKIINMVGCGTAATGTPIFGNGASPVAVRLISQPPS